MGQEQVAQIAQRAMLKALKDYKPQNETVEKGIDNAMRIRDQFVEAENTKDGIHSHEVDINDLNPHIRLKVQSKDFVKQVEEMCGVRIFSRGTYTEPGKRAVLGTRKQYLLIEGSNKEAAMQAYNEVKRQIDEMNLAQTGALARSYDAGFSGKFGKF